MSLAAVFLDHCQQHLNVQLDSGDSGVWNVLWSCFPDVSWCVSEHMQVISHWIVFNSQMSLMQSASGAFLRGINIVCKHCLLIGACYSHMLKSTLSQTQHFKWCWTVLLAILEQLFNVHFTDFEFELYILLGNKRKPFNTIRNAWNESHVFFFLLFVSALQWS